MKPDKDPEYNLISGLGGLVPHDALGEKRARPSTEQLGKV